jgi:isoquinoline 1-oxidoreductase beta subunit
MSKVKLSRRGFLISTAVVGGGFALSLYLPRKGVDSKVVPVSSSELSAWLAIRSDDQIVVRVSTPEIGNGAMTQIAMNVAEELNCDWSKVQVEYASVKRDYFEDGAYSVGFQPFFGGHSTDPKRLEILLQAGASARERLRAAAAAQWQVDVTEVEAVASVLSHKPSGRTLRFGDVAEAAAAISLEAEPKPKPRSEWCLLGKATPAKLNLPSVVNGSAVYGLDVKVPGMVHAAIKQPPVLGGSLKSHKPEAVLGMLGVRAVVVLDPSKRVGSPVRQKATFGMNDTEMQSGVAVIADHYWQAKQALDALPVEWDDGDGAQWRNIEQIYTAATEVLDGGQGMEMSSMGDVDKAIGNKTVSADYLTPYCEHAVMEPLNGTALYTETSLEIWHPCQDTKQAFWVAVDETGIAPENVTINQTLVGGGFGRRVVSPEVRSVVAIAREYPGVPVKVIWSREETTRQGRYRTLVAGRYSAKLNDAGVPLSLDSKACFGGNLQLPFGWMDTPYVISGAIPNARFITSTLENHILTGAFRGPCYNSHAFMMETFIDECAVAAADDPLEYRLNLLKDWDPAWSQCLKVAAEKAGWGKPLPKGEGIGIAIANWPKAMFKEEGTTVCVAARVAVSREGKLSVKQVDLAFDCGTVLNRDAVKSQLEGGVIFGMNVALNEEITLSNGAVVESNFHDYPILHMRDTPEINIHFDALSGHERTEMIGEAPIGPIGPAIGNAIFHATGKRLRATPFRKQDLSWS